LLIFCHELRAYGHIWIRHLIPHQYLSCSVSYSWGDHYQKSLRLHHLKSNWDEIWRDCLSSKYTSIDRGYDIIHSRRRQWRHFTKKPTAMSFQIRHRWNLASCTAIIDWRSPIWDTKSYL